jgi:glycosyltransferase involved in cell wall biosynthesis
VAATDPAISVVIPARDSAATIGVAVASAATQTFRPGQVIVVDDGSRDDSAERARAAGEVTVLQTEGAGVATARNEGASHATGDWLAFLDADDRWDPEHLAAAVAVIRAAPDAVACLCAATPVDESGRAVGSHTVGSELTFADLLTRRVTPTTSGMLVRRAAFEAERGFFTGFGRAAGVEDFDLWLRLALAGRFIGQPRPLVTYVVQDRRDAGRSREELLALEHDRELVVDRLEARGDVPDDLLRAGRRAVRTGTAHYWLRAGFKREARRCARASMRCGWGTEAAITLLAASLPRPVTELGRRGVRRRRS